MIPASPHIDFDHRRQRTTSPVRPEVEKRCYLEDKNVCATARREVPGDRMTAEREDPDAGLSRCFFSIELRQGRHGPPAMSVRPQ